MPEKIIETFNLTKVYKLRKRKEFLTALNKINLQIYKGEILGLLGPNGAGKTTLIELLSTLKSPTSGDANVNGCNIYKDKTQVKNSIALMLGAGMIYYGCTAFDNLKFFAKLYGVNNYPKKIKTLAMEFDMADWINQYVEFYSTGMKMKLALMRTLLINRPILYLDEPTHGLDPNATKYMMQQILDLKKRNKTVLMPTHRMHVANEVCDRIALIKKGIIVKIDTKEEIKKMIQDKLLIDIKIEEKKHELMSELKAQNFVEEIIQKNEDSMFRIKVSSNSYYKEIFDIVRNYKILKFMEIEPTLEDVFTTILS